MDRSRRRSRFRGAWKARSDRVGYLRRRAGIFGCPLDVNELGDAGGDSHLAQKQRGLRMRTLRRLAMAGVLLAPTGALAKDVTIKLPIIAPITGVLALEGVNQVNGAMLAVEHAPAN